MRVAVLKEIRPGERRVALVPEIVAILVDAGFEIEVEAGAGAAASFSDRRFEEAGAAIVSSRADLLSRAEAVVKVQKPTAEEVELLPEGSILIAFLQPLDDREGIERLARKGVLGFALLWLIPIYFLIGGFGGARRSYAAMKFLIYSLVGGLVMLASVIG